MPPLVTDPAISVHAFPTQTVEKINYLGDPAGWVTVPYLYCDSFTVAANGYDTAKLTYEIGESVVQAGSGAFANFAPVDLRGKFVRVTSLQPVGPNLVWVGHVRSDEVERDAVVNVGGVNKLVGKTQEVAAVGLEYFLDRKQIDSAVVRVTGKVPNYLRVQRPLVFNGGPTAAFDPGTAVRGNRSNDVGGAGVYDFTDSPDAAALWNAEQIIKHLLQYHTMLNSAGSPAPAAFTFSAADAATGFLSGIYPVLKSENLTVFQALNQICAAQRGLVWWLEYAEPAGVPTITIRVNSAALSAVSLPSGGTLPANTNQVTLDYDSEIDVEIVKISQLGHRDYHQVVMRGARMTSTCTVARADNTIIPDWSQLTGAADVGTEQKYKDAGKTYADYPPLSTEKKTARNDAIRKADAFYRVFSCFRIPTTWDGKTGDGSTPNNRNWTFPTLSPTGSVTGSLTWNAQGLRMLNTLRLKRGWDYSNPQAPKSNVVAGSVGELMPPFTIVRVAQTPDRYQYMESVDKSDFAAGSPSSSSMKTNYSLSMQQTCPGFRVKAAGMQHALALGHWTGAEPSAATPEVDYDTIRATVCLESDSFCEGKYPTAGFPTNTPLEVLLIDVGTTYRLDFLAQNTITGLMDGQPVLANTAAVLRDDRKYLEDLARLAYEWFQLDRNTLDVTFRQVRPLFSLGMLVTTAGAGSTLKNINTMVTKITYNLKAGTMQVVTADKTLDVRSLSYHA